MDTTEHSTRRGDGGGIQGAKSTVLIERVQPAREVPDADGAFIHALAYGLEDMVFYRRLCDRVPLIMEERHPEFQFRSELVAPDRAMHGIPGYVDVTKIDFQDGQDHFDEGDELCSGVDGFSDQVLGLVSELRAEPWDANLTRAHRRMPWQDTTEMRELVDRLTDRDQGYATRQSPPANARIPLAGSNHPSLRQVLLPAGPTGTGERDNF